LEASGVGGFKKQLSLRAQRSEARQSHQHENRTILFWCDCFALLAMTDVLCGSYQDV
jgi:hypothetical protein